MKIWRFENLKMERAVKWLYGQIVCVIAENNNSTI